jgi:hypothetical protein
VLGEHGPESAADDGGRLERRVEARSLLLEHRAHLPTIRGKELSPERSRFVPGDLVVWRRRLLLADVAPCWRLTLARYVRRGRRLTLARYARRGPLRLGDCLGPRLQFLLTQLEAILHAVQLLQRFAETVPIVYGIESGREALKRDCASLQLEVNTLGLAVVLVDARQGIVHVHRPTLSSVVPFWAFLIFEALFWTPIALPSMACTSMISARNHALPSAT